MPSDVLDPLLLFGLLLMYLSATQIRQWPMRGRIILQWNPFGAKFPQLVPLIQGAPVKTVETATENGFPAFVWMERN
jgi:hypothetical protein